MIVQNMKLEESKDWRSSSKRESKSVKYYNVHIAIVHIFKSALVIIRIIKILYIKWRRVWDYFIE
jgi:hypothetical protein